MNLSSRSLKTGEHPEHQAGDNDFLMRRHPLIFDRVCGHRTTPTSVRLTKIYGLDMAVQQQVLNIDELKQRLLHFDVARIDRSIVDNATDERLGTSSFVRVQT